jgi:dUTP pyrophosphatase
MVSIPLHQLDPDLPTPHYAHPGDAGVDLYARNDIHLAPGGGRALVPTGVVIALPVGFGGFVLPRSGLALKHGITCLNTPGLIDPGYRGEVSVLLVNTDSHAGYDVRRGDRIAQLVVMAVEQAAFDLVSAAELPGSERGAGGFGHSGR